MAPPQLEIAQVSMAVVPCLLGLGLVTLMRLTYNPMPEISDTVGTETRRAYVISQWMAIETYSQSLPVASAGISLAMAVYLVRRDLNGWVFSATGEAGDLWVLAWAAVCAALLGILGLWVRPWWIKECTFKREVSLEGTARSVDDARWLQYLEIRGDPKEMWNKRTLKAWWRRSCHWALAFTPVFLTIIVVVWR